MPGITTSHNLARMAKVPRDEINRLTKLGVLHPSGLLGKSPVFEDAYARRVAPFIGARHRMARSLASSRRKFLTNSEEA